MEFLNFVRHKGPIYNRTRPPVQALPEVTSRTTLYIIPG